MGIKEPVASKVKGWYNQPVTVMNDFRLIRPLLLIWATAAIGCGAAATLPPEAEPTNLTPALSQAVWHPEVGDQLSVTTIGSPVSLEDGSLSLSSVSIRPVDAQSSFVHGVMLVDIPDEPQVAIVASVGFGGDRIKRRAPGSDLCGPERVPRPEPDDRPFRGVRIGRTADGGNRLGQPHTSHSLSSSLLFVSFPYPSCPEPLRTSFFSSHLRSRPVPKRR
jgi:hypothetical protein